MSRDAEIAAFLALHGYGTARAVPLAQDASLRRYLRLHGGPPPAVLMDAPPPEDIRPFIRVAAHLAGLGLSVPEIIAADAEAGLLLEEDLGDALFPALMECHRTLTRSAARGDLSQRERWKEDGRGSEGSPLPLAGEVGSRSEPGEGGPSQEDLFDAAVDALVVMHRAPALAWLPDWDRAAMRDTALGTLLDWWWPAVFGAKPSEAARADIAAGLHAMLAPLDRMPRGFVHRDFFAGNLVWLPKRAGVRRVGILDFQSAARGHPAYDLVSLTQDARRDIAPSLAARAMDRYLAARPELDAEDFGAAAAICAAQRHLRVAAQWVRLALREKQARYLAHGPRTWRLLGAALREPAAAPLAVALDRWLPAALRGNPAGLAA